MTWKDLTNQIARMSDEQSNTDVTVVVLGEAYPIDPALECKEAEKYGLDPNHPYLKVCD